MNSPRRPLFSEISHYVYAALYVNTNRSLVLCSQEHNNLFLVTLQIFYSYPMEDNIYEYIYIYIASMIMPPPSVTGEVYIFSSSPTIFQLW